MNSRLKIVSFENADIKHLIKGFLLWYKKNNTSQNKKSLTDHAIDLYEASDTSLYKLVSKNEVIGVFFLIENKFFFEIGGGLIKKNLNPRNAYFVFDFAINKCLKHKKQQLKLSVINKHYKYKSIIRYYSNYGFKILSIDEDSTLMSVNV